MSYLATAYVRRLTTTPTGRKLTKLEKLLLFSLAEAYNDKTGAPWPSIQTLAEECLASKQGIRDAIKGLAADGVLHVERRQREDGEWLSNKYHFTFIEQFGPKFDHLVKSVDHLVKPLDYPLVNSVDHVVNSHETLTVIEPVKVEKVNEPVRVGDAASPPAPARAKAAASKPVKTTEDVALAAECNRVYDAITADHVLSRGDCIQLRQAIKPFVERYGADDLIGWHRAACKAKDGNYVPLSYASRGINGWLAAGRPDTEPNPFQRGGTNGRNAAPSAVVAASKKYGDNEHYAQLEREHNEWLKSVGEAV